MQPTTSRTVPVITCDGTGVVSHAGTVLLAELADRVGLTAALSEATDSLRERRAGHDPSRVLVDVAVAIADGAVTISASRSSPTSEVCTVRSGASRRPRRCAQAKRTDCPTSQACR